MTKIPREEGAECGLGVGTPVQPAQTHPLFLSFQSTQLDHLLVVFLCHVWQSVGGRTGLAGWDGNLPRPRRVREGMRKSKEEQQKERSSTDRRTNGFCRLFSLAQVAPGSRRWIRNCASLPIGWSREAGAGWDGTRAEQRPSGTPDWRMTEERAGPSGVSEF